MATSILPSRDGAQAMTDPEVSAQVRRMLPASYKLRILCEADGCAQGELGALLRREDLYSSQLASRRKQRREGALTALAPRRRGRPPVVSTEATALAAVQAENERLTRQVAAAEVNGAGWPKPVPITGV